MGRSRMEIKGEAECPVMGDGGQVQIERVCESAAGL